MKEARPVGVAGNGREDRETAIKKPQKQKTLFPTNTHTHTHTQTHTHTDTTHTHTHTHQSSNTPGHCRTSDKETRNNHR